MSEYLASMRAAWKNSQLSGANTAYLEAIYEDYLQDPNLVEPSWRAYFDDLVLKNQGLPDVSHEAIRQAFINMASSGNLAACSGVNYSVNQQNSLDCSKPGAVHRLIQAYRRIGHLRAQTDPLELNAVISVPKLEKEFYGLTDQDLDQVIDLKDQPGFKSLPSSIGASGKTLREVLGFLEQTYSCHIGAEYMHLSNLAERLWVQEKLEQKNTQQKNAPQEKADCLKILQDLISADGLEKYLGMKYVGQKRFSLEGGDSLIPMINDLIDQSSLQGVSEVVIGMAHRGRLNALVNILGKSPQDLMAEFEGKHAKNLLSGDVKYHNGFASDIETSHGKIVHLAMAFNPSHLEIVSPVVSGSVRARQDRRHQERSEVLPIIIHGDAAFSGQGVVMEHLNLSQLRGFKTNGSVHIVINNQVGFTTSNILDARSGTYCTDIAKMIEAPVFHVNGDDPEAVIFVTRLAIDYRMKFKKDVVIDLVCYRLHGHNESDEPSGTQPLMYQKIKSHLTPYKIYAKNLIKNNLITQAEVDGFVQAYKNKLESGAAVVKLINKNYKNNWTPYLNKSWRENYKNKSDKNNLINLARKLEQLPENFPLQKQVQKALEDRVLMTDGKLGINWGYAEILAYASLLDLGYGVRLVGQDAGRGTFSHRHGVLHSQLDDSLFIPLRNIIKDRKDKNINLEIIDSTLSEEAVMAFEYGYSGSSPETLVLWEAQFGDFANGAQVVIDQFICSAEEKWGRYSGLVLLLPHGQEGQGSEHSSARLERFLQLCANENMQVCVPSTPAQIFHVLRRQMLREYRKPLVIMTPKSLLRHPLVISQMDDLVNGKFECVIDEIDENINSSFKNNKINKLIICQGKVFYDLLAKRRELNLENSLIIRLEQLYPIPELELKTLFKKYENIKNIIWCQEEPVNQGAWHMIQHFLRECFANSSQVLTYAGRAAFASPAVGYPALYKAQQEKLIQDALGL